MTIKERKQLKQHILRLLREKEYTPLRMREMAILLDVPPALRGELQRVLDALVKEGLVKKDSLERYTPVKRAGRSAGENTPPLPVLEKDCEAPYKDKSEAAHKGTTELINDFSDKIIRQANKCPLQVQPGDLEGRRDLRKLPMIAIERQLSAPMALSLQREGENFLVGLHLPDVANFVQAGSAMDKEAMKRIRTRETEEGIVPMLPVELTGGCCAFPAGEDRLALSCFMTLDGQGSLLSLEMAETVLRVDAGLTTPDLARLLRGRTVEELRVPPELELLMVDLACLKRVLWTVEITETLTALAVKGLTEIYLPGEMAFAGAADVMGESVEFSFTFHSYRELLLCRMVKDHLRGRLNEQKAENYRRQLEELKDQA